MFLLGLKFATFVWFCVFDCVGVSCHVFIVACTMRMWYALCLETNVVAPTRVMNPYIASHVHSQGSIEHAFLSMNIREINIGDGGSII